MGFLSSYSNSSISLQFVSLEVGALDPVQRKCKLFKIMAIIEQQFHMFTVYSFWFYSWYSTKCEAWKGLGYAPLRQSHKLNNFGCQVLLRVHNLKRNVLDLFETQSIRDDVLCRGRTPERRKVDGFQNVGSLRRVHTYLPAASWIPLNVCFLFGKYRPPRTRRRFELNLFSLVISTMWGLYVVNYMAKKPSSRCKSKHAAVQSFGNESQD